MANFDAQVVELVGVTYSTDQAALDQFITEGANEVINAMPRSIMERVAEETTVTDGTTTSEGHKILNVLRNDGTIDQPCRKVPAKFAIGPIKPPIIFSYLHLQSQSTHLLTH